jgi:hypothetical protein
VAEEVVAAVVGLDEAEAALVPAARDARGLAVAAAAFAAAVVALAAAVAAPAAAVRAGAAA